MNNNAIRNASTRLGTVAAAAALALAGSLAAADELPGVPSGSYALDPGHASLHFVANHFGFANFVTRFNDFDASIELDMDDLANSSLQVTVDTNSVDANHEAFENHLRTSDFFDVEEYPEATFRSTSIEVTGPTTLNVTGDLTLLGVTRPVTLETRVFGGGTHPMNQSQVIGFEAKGTITRSEFGMSYALPAVGDDVELWINAEFILQE